ncbi:MAG: DUF1365 domain-containing protein [Devosia sp.]|uniref:DUF1365 domain-containing protein n=1 Tax=Devosia sp. TaxID=1871048 RepID=UPI001AD0B48B|nr:DUF1365 domain-containing protein [Devosia sp.]MBN9315103.1 DUF1365 domain-containing protein [Devosia sp.]
MRSAIYTGEVVHARMRPRSHRLHYRVFCLLLDLDELPRLDLKLLGIERAGIFGFRARDHGDRHMPLRQWAAQLVAEAGIDWDGTRIELLCYPRLFGFVFNPLSVYFCYGQAGEVQAILYEVHNTHGERHTYVMPARPDAGGVVRHEARKSFFVSPFMPMDCLYRFRILPPGDGVGVSILENDADGLLLTASFTGQRRELSDRNLLRLLLRYPLMTLKVVAGIHYEALKLLLKGVRFLDWHAARRRIDHSAPMRAEAPVTEPAE